MCAFLTAFLLAVLGQADASPKVATENEESEFVKSQQMKRNEFYRTEAATYAITFEWRSPEGAENATRSGAAVEQSSALW
jgi:ribosomal protein L32E